ncbi:MAG: hypothetical protein ACKE5M_07040 [Methylophilaceae bacterium]
MVKASKLFFTTLLLGAFIFSNNVVAKECYEPSPNLVNLNDEYYNLDETIKLSNEDKDTLNNFFRSATGKWKGTSQHIECRGPDRAPRKIVKNAIVKAKAKLASRTQLTINAEKDYTEERVKKSDNFTLLNLKNTYNLAFPGNNSLVLSEKYRRANNYQANSKDTKNKTTKIRTSRLSETIYEISSSTNALTLTRLYYTNGVYVGEETWFMNAN